MYSKIWSRVKHVYSAGSLSELSQSGVLTDLPKLQQVRKGHGCSFYTNEDNIKVRLVESIL